MSVVEGKVGYFTNPGSQNSEKVIEIIKNRMKGDDITTRARVGIGSIPNTRLPMDEAGKVIQRTLDLEVNPTDTSGDYEDSGERIGKAIVGRREHIIISTKTWAADKATAQRR